LRDDEAFGGFYVAGKSHFNLSKIVWLLRLTHGNAPEGGYYLAAFADLSAAFFAARYFFQRLA
jgi:hypothetical protein